MDKSRVALGRWGEQRVADHYQKHGYQVIDRNWKIKGGELDLVLTRGHEIVFCEVKTRSTARFGSAAEAVGYRKQQILRRTAASWLDCHSNRGRVRFDVASVVEGHITVIRAAF